MLAFKSPTIAEKIWFLSGVAPVLAANPARPFVETAASVHRNIANSDSDMWFSTPDASYPAYAETVAPASFVHDTLHDWYRTPHDTSHIDSCVAMSDNAYSWFVNVVINLGSWLLEYAGNHSAVGCSSLDLDHG